MTKEQASEIKKVLNSGEKHYTTNYRTKTGEFRVRVASFRPQHTAEEINDGVKKAVVEVLNMLSKNGMRPRYRIDNIKYQGYYNDYFVVFE